MISRNPQQSVQYRPVTGLDRTPASVNQCSDYNYEQKLLKRISSYIDIEEMIADGFRRQEMENQVWISNLMKMTREQQEQVNECLTDNGISFTLRLLHVKRYKV